MRENGLPQVLTWRWAPCAAFVLGSISFAAFMLLAIPDHIGQVPAEATTNSLRFQLAGTQPAPAPQSDWSSDTTNTVSSTPRLADRTATRNTDASSFPKRGFSPPLERPEPPPAPATPPAMPPQPQLNVPPPVPAPAEQPPAPPPPQPEPARDGQAAPPPPDAPAAQPAPAPAPAPAPN